MLFNGTSHQVRLSGRISPMSIRRFRRFLQQVFTVIAIILLLHCYLKGNIDEWFARPYSEFEYPLEIDLPSVIGNLKENRSVGVPPITELPFKFLTVSICHNKLLLAVVVKSSVDHGYNREIIRATWGNVSKTRSDIKLFFHVGISTNEFTNGRIQQEHVKNKDLIQSDFIDTYYNNTFKSIMGLRWAHLYCKSARFLLYVDDDYYVSLKNLIAYLETLDDTVEKLWMGHLCLNGEPDRRHWLYAGKWQVSLQKYPYRYWPPFMNGGSYLLSADLVTDFYLASKFIEFIAMDDVFLGIIARKLGVEGRGNETLFPNPGVPRLLVPKDDPSLKHVVANHRFGEVEEVQYIWNRFKNH